MNTVRTRVTAAAVASLFVLTTFSGSAVATSPWYEGFDDNFGNDALNHYSVVQGSTTGWRVSSQTLQAIAAGQVLELDLPGINIVGNRLVCVKVNPEQTINSAFYTGTTINVAELIQINLGTVNDVVQLVFDVQDQVITILDQNGIVIDSLPSQNLIPFNTLTDLCIHVIDPLGLVLVQIGNGPWHALEAVVPSGSIQFVQPSVNTARVIFADLKVRTTPNVPTDVEAFSGPGLNEVTIQWDVPEQTGGMSVSRYVVYRGTSPDALEPIAEVGAGDLQYTDRPVSGVTPSTDPVYYRVAAVNTVGEGPVSSLTCMLPGAAGMLLVPNLGVGCGEHGAVGSAAVSWLL